MLRTLAIVVYAAFAAGESVAEMLQTEPPCEVAVEHVPDRDVNAGDLNRPHRPASLELELRRYIPAGAEWFLEAALATITVDLTTGAVTDSTGLLASSAVATCD